MIPSLDVYLSDGKAFHLGDPVRVTTLIRGVQREYTGMLNAITRDHLVVGGRGVLIEFVERVESFPIRLWWAA